MANPHRDRDRRRRRDGFNQMEDAFARFGKIDVSIDGKAERQSYGRGRPERDNRNQERRPQRPRLEFTELICLEQGDSRCRITVADGHAGRIYNFTVERQNRDRPTRFFRESDAHDVVRLVQRAAEWIEAHRST